MSLRDAAFARWWRSNTCPGGRCQGLLLVREIASSSHFDFAQCALLATTLKLSLECLIKNTRHQRDLDAIYAALPDPDFARRWIKILKLTVEEAVALAM